MHLASDAVRAAAESPFLDGALASASGVLCCINLPPSAQRFAGGAGGPAPLQGLQVRVGLQDWNGGWRMACVAVAAVAGFRCRCLPFACCMLFCLLYAVLLAVCCPFCCKFR